MRVDELAVLTGFGLSREWVVVDLGAGTGQFALAAARVCGRVVAVEVSPVMLEALMRRASEEGVANFDVVGSGFLTYVHEGPRADFAYSRYAAFGWKRASTPMMAYPLRYVLRSI